MRIFVLLLGILKLIKSLASTPHIFNESYTFCDFKFGKNTISFPDKLYSIYSTAFNLHFSLCKTPQKICQDQTSSCLISKISSGIINLGDEFQLEDGSTLVSKNGASCTTNLSKTYTLSISLYCTDSLKFKPPTLIHYEEKDCFFEVLLMNPNCQPRCTQLIQNSYLLDMRNLNRPFQVENQYRKFSLNLCGPNVHCPEGITACEVTNNSVVPLADYSSQHFVYDVGKDELTARGRYKLGGTVRNVRILMKCKWSSALSNPKYKAVPNQTKGYKFELESSFACIKLPQNCRISSITNLNFDLSRLNNENGWDVNDVPHGSVLLNICGNLGNLKGICRDQYSQVCHFDGNSYINRGSILKSLIVHDNFIQAIYVSGSQCMENSTLSYSTEIEFKCSKIEKGPRFKEFYQCVMVIMWETPHACPFDLYQSDTCSINDRVSNRNLQELYTLEDKVYSLAPNEKLIYNLCGPIHMPCNNFTNVSFCLVSEQRETVVGWATKHLKSLNGELTMSLEGASCLTSNAKSRVEIQFLCNYDNPSLPPILTRKGNCTYNMNIFTPKACLSQGKVYDCVYNTNKLTFNLSSLFKKRDNYIISKDDIDFIFNMCGPIVSHSGALCGGDTMVCWKNKTEINIKHKFKSLGGVGKPRLLNNDLIVEAEMGAFCPSNGHFKTIFHFKCSDKQFSPTFMFELNCLYHFEWKTPEACPKDRNCLIPGTTFDLSSLKSRSILVTIDNGTSQFLFDLCQDIYTKKSYGHRSSHILVREFITNKSNYTIKLNLTKTCEKLTPIKQVIIQVICSNSKDDFFKQTSFTNCILNMILHTKIVCSKFEVQQEEMEINSKQLNKYAKNLTIGELHKINKLKTNCTLVNPQVHYEFNLNKIETQEAYFNGSKYVLNFKGNDSKCESFFCKNDVVIWDASCPTSAYDYVHQQVALEFESQFDTDSKLKLFLKCNHTKTGFRILDDQNSEITALFNLPEACFLLKRNVDLGGSNGLSSTTVAVIVGVFIILVGFLVIIYLNRMQFSFYRRYRFSRIGKNNVPIYCKNCSD